MRLVIKRGRRSNHQQPSLVKTDNKPLLLIVDDEKTQREGLRAVLEEHYDIYLADDAEAAMNLLEVERFDVLLTDYRMPKEDGLALIVRAKSLAKPPVCILMTAYGSEDIAVEAMKHGADDYIGKGGMLLDDLEKKISSSSVTISDSTDRFVPYWRDWYTISS